MGLRARRFRRLILGERPRAIFLFVVAHAARHRARLLAARALAASPSRRASGSTTSARRWRAPASGAARSGSPRASCTEALGAPRGLRRVRRALRVPPRGLLLRRAVPLLPRLRRVHGARHRAARHRAARHARGLARGVGRARSCSWWSSASPRRRSSSLRLEAPRGGCQPATHRAAAGRASRSPATASGSTSSSRARSRPRRPTRASSTASPTRCATAVTGKGWVRQGISLREPAPLPPLAVPAHRPNVLLVITESVRADAICSAPLARAARRASSTPSPPDRIPLGRLTTQSSGTFTSCVMLWTGLAPDADFTTMHHAPVLWEVARAVGYRTAYISSQNLRYDDFGAFLERAGIDVHGERGRSGRRRRPHIGAPDENATARMLEFVRSARRARGRAVLRRAAPLEHALALPRRSGAAAVRPARRVAHGGRRAAAQPLPQQRPDAGAHGRRASPAAPRRCPAGTTRSSSSCRTTASSSASTAASIT